MRFTAPVDTTINTVRAGIGYKFYDRPGILLTGRIGAAALSPL